MAVDEGDRSTTPLERHAWLDWTWMVVPFPSLPLSRAESAEQGNNGGAVPVLLLLDAAWSCAMKATER